MTQHQIIDALESLPTDELSSVVETAARMIALRSGKCVAPDESELLRIINRPLPVADAARYRTLKDKRSSGTLTENELGELHAIARAEEQYAAEWLDGLIKLSQLRGVALDQVMLDLGIEVPDAE